MHWDSVRETHGNSDIRKAGFSCSVDNKYVCSMVGKKKNPWNKRPLQVDMGRKVCLWWVQWRICSHRCGQTHHLKAEVTFFSPCSLHFMKSTKPAFKNGNPCLSLSWKKWKLTHVGLFPEDLSLSGAGCMHLAVSCKPCCDPAWESCSIPGPPVAFS